MQDHLQDMMPFEAATAQQEIAELVTAYCRGLDRADAALLEPLFHDDSTIISGAFSGNGRIFATDICAIMRTVFNQTFHSIISQRIDLAGDSAFGEAHVVAVCTMTEENGSRSELLTGGHYVDRFTRRDGRWKFAERRFVIDWSVVKPATDTTGGGQSFWRCQAEEKDHDVQPARRGS